MNITYQIKLGPMLWACKQGIFSPTDRLKDGESTITPRTIARELNRAMDKINNLHGWKMEIIRNKD